MGGEQLMHKFYKINLQSYDGLQAGINDTLYNKYISNNKAQYIIDPIPQIINNNYAYFVLIDFIYNDELIQNYIEQLIEINESEYSEIINQS